MRGLSSWKKDLHSTEMKKKFIFIWPQTQKCLKLYLFIILAPLPCTWAVVLLFLSINKFEIRLSFGFVFIYCDSAFGSASSRTFLTRLLLKCDWQLNMDWSQPKITFGVACHCEKRLYVGHDLFADVRFSKSLKIVTLILKDGSILPNLTFQFQSLTSISILLYKKMSYL